MKRLRIWLGEWAWTFLAYDELSGRRKRGLPTLPPDQWGKR